MAIPTDTERLDWLSIEGHSVDREDDIWVGVVWVANPERPGCGITKLARAGVTIRDAIDAVIAAEAGDA